MLEVPVDVIREKFDKDAFKESVASEFPIRHEVVDEKAISLNKNYIIKICGRSNKIGIVTSDSKCEVYSHDGASLKQICKFSGHKGTICDIRFSPENENLLFTGSSDGSIKLWDIRASEKWTTSYEEPAETKQFTKPFSAFDISCDNRVLCGGSDLAQGDAFMLFFDIRGKELLGAYWNSHTDDIVQVEFSKKHPNKLVTGSVDGLVNVFDVSELTEDDALQYSLSTECAVDKLNWISEDTVSCVTQNVDLQLWNIETADQTATFSREDITKAMRRTCTDDCYVINVYNTKSNLPMVLGGSYSERGECMRTLKIADGKLEPLSNFEENKQIVRCSWFDYENEFLVTGGESGILNLWQKSAVSILNTPHVGKISSAMEKVKIRKKKPY